MTVGNIWLGSLVEHTIIASGDLVANSYIITTTSLSTPAAFYGAGVTMSGASTNLVFITLTPAAGANYSMTVFNTSTSGQNDIFYRPDPPLFVFPGDSINLMVKNTNATGGVYGFITLMY